MELAERPKLKLNLGRNFGQNRTETVSVCPLPLPVLSIQESVGVERLRLVPILGVEVKRQDVVEHDAALWYLVTVEKTVLFGTVGQGGGTDAAEPLNFHDGGIAVGQDCSVIKGRVSPI